MAPNLDKALCFISASQMPANALYETLERLSSSDGNGFNPTTSTLCSAFLLFWEDRRERRTDSHPLFVYCLEKNKSMEEDPYSFKDSEP